VCIPVAAIGLYFLSGTPEAIEGRMPVVAQADDAQGTPADHPDTGKQVEAMIAQLAARLQAEPDNLEGWLMMARSLRFMRRHAEAADAFERAFPMMENNAELLADYADTLAMASGGNLNGKPIDLINRALQLDPRNIQALWLKGTHDLETENYDGALESWRRIQQLVPPGSEDAQAMANNVAEVESRMRASGLAIPAVQALPAAAVAAANVSGRVKLDPALAAQVSPGDTLFIYARAATGPKMPLAILRKTAGDLPLEFRLDETMAMMPAMSLANYQDVVIGARISKDGKATAQSGDLQGQTEAIRVGSSDVDITINSVIP
jgi:cytochrome c-type biogenesis protein CcmH